MTPERRSIPRESYPPLRLDDLPPSQGRPQRISGACVLVWFVLPAAFWGFIALMLVTR